MISIFDIFKIGIGPSSSHTVGPMKAAAAFSDDLKQSGLDAQTERIVIDIYGSLALTGRGHGTFDALLLGLEGSLPHDDDYLSVYVPTTPNPTGGYYIMVKKSDVRELDMSVDEALKYVISLGMVMPDDLPPKPQAEIRCLDK